MAWDDMDPDGAGEPGDMRYDYERTKQRRQMERQMAEQRAAASDAAMTPAADPNGPDGTVS